MLSRRIAVVLMCVCGVTMGLAQGQSLEEIIEKANAAGDTGNVGELGNKPERLEWLRDNGFGMFLHWGVDAQLGSVISHTLVGASDDYVERYVNELPQSFYPKKFDAEEYVLLACKYPSHELIPKAMSRIGGQFEDLGLKRHKEATAKLEKEDQASQNEGTRLMDQANAEFIRAARIFTMLQKRYPDNMLAGLAGVRAGENLIRLKDYGRAIEILQKVYENEDYDGSTVLAAAMFWTAWASELKAAEEYRSDGKMVAFKLYNRVRFEHSATPWAKKARGRLASKAFEKIIEGEKKRREALLEGLKNR